MRRQASGYADQVLNNCMRAEGFSYLCHCASAMIGADIEIGRATP
jgi:hypothetical protein